MPTDFYTDLRKTKKQQFLQFLTENKDKGFDITKLIALFSLKTGNRTSTIRVYYNELKESGLVD